MATTAATKIQTVKVLGKQVQPPGVMCTAVRMAHFNTSAPPFYIQRLRVVASSFELSLSKDSGADVPVLQPL